MKTITLRHFYLYVCSLSFFLLTACGGGGGGSSGSSGPSAPPVVQTLTLGAPTANPVVVPQSGVDTSVTFMALVTGNASAPSTLLLDEVDASGASVLHEGVAQLRDDGQAPDAKLGDRLYTGTLAVSGVAAAEHYYRVRTIVNGNTEISSPNNIWVSGCPSTSRPSDPAMAVNDAQSGSVIFSNEIMIRTAANVPPDLTMINNLLTGIQGHVVGCIPALHQYLIEFVNTTSDAAGVYKAITSLLNNYSPNTISSAFPNGQSLSQPTANPFLCSNGVYAKECQWYLDQIRAPLAWQVAGGGDPQLGVAVIDFGVDCTVGGLPCDKAIYNTDPLDHGTGVAGIIASPMPSGTTPGITGVAWNTYLYPYSFLSASGSQYKMNELITTAMSQADMRVINVSAATGADFDHQIQDALCAAIGSGRLVVAAAGNASGTDAATCSIKNIYPAAYNDPQYHCNNGADLQKGLLVVGATDNQNNLASWQSGSTAQCSNQAHVDLYAPGKDLLTLSAQNSYAIKSGTSYATPLVSGTAAVLWTAHPNYTPAQIHDQIINSAVILSQATTVTVTRLQTGDPRMAGKPLLDMYKAVGGVDTLTPPNTTPNAYSVPAIIGAPLQSLVSTTAVTISGMDNPSPISVSVSDPSLTSPCREAYYQIDNGGYTSASGSIVSGQSVQVQVRSADTPTSSCNAMLSIGGVKQIASVTTRDPQTTPGDYQFLAQPGVALNTLLTSNSQTITGIDPTTVISITGGQYSINNGPFTSSAGTIAANQSVRVQVTSSNQYATRTTASLTIGTVSRDFVVTTLIADTTPNAIAISAQSNVTPGSTITTAPIVVNGINAPTVISISGGSYSLDNGKSFTSAAGVITPGQSVIVQQTTSTVSGATSSATLTIGGVSTVFSATNLVLDTTPDAFAFTAQSNVATNTLVTSNSQTITGINSVTPISITGGMYSINGAPFTGGAGTIQNGQSVQVQVTSPSQLASNATAILTVGTSSVPFSVSTVGAITTPNTFAFTAQNNIALSTSVTSNAITVSGINTAAPITISGGSYSIDGGAYTTSAGTINNGQTVTVQLTTATTPATMSTATLNIGGVTANFDVTTVAPDTTPDPFAFVSQTNIALNTVVTSAPITITGINTATPISISAGGSYSINGGAYVTTAGTITNGQSVSVRLTSSANFATAVSATLTIGSVTGNFSVTTLAADTVPDAYAFTAQTNIALSTLVTSNTVTITGINTSTPVSVTGGLVSINGGAYAATGNIQNNQTISVQQTSSATPNTTTTAVVNVGTITANFAVTTVPADTVPNAFSFTAQTNIALSTLTTSNSVTITGINTSTPVSVTGGFISINGGAYAATGNITNNQTITVQQTSSATPNTKTTAIVNVGGVTANFDVTTVPVDTVPDAFAFTTQTNVALSTLTTSNTVTITGINSPAAISITGGSYSINGGAYTSVTGTISNNQTVSVQLTSSASISTAVNATLTIGGVSGTFTVSTVGADTVPDAYAFTAQTNIGLSTLTTSNTVTITGINTSTPVSVTGGLVSINGGAYVSTGTILNNQTLSVQQTSSATPNTKTTAVVNVGGVTANFDVTTVPADTTPDPFAFTAQSNVAQSTVITSNTVTITGINTTTPISISAGGSYSINGGAYVTTAGTITNGQTVSVRVTSSANFSTAVSATLTIGTGTGVFSATTLAADTVPDAYAFTAQTNIALSTLVTSNTVTITGINTTTPVSVTGGLVSINGGAYAATGNIQNNQTLSVQQTSSAAPNTTTTAVVNVGSVTANFAVTTVPADTVPDPFAFTAQTNVALTTVINSNSVFITGINTSTPVSVTNGKVSINGGAFTTTGTILNNQTIQVQQTSSTLANTTTTATVNIGGVIASFDVTTIPAFTVTASAGTGGTTAPTTVSVNQGSTTNFGITVTTGYTLTGVSSTCGTGSLSGSDAVGYVYTTAAITANCAVTANFALQTFTVTATSAGNGAISTTTPMPVNYNTVVTYTLTPNTGYNIGTVSGCGGTLNAATSTYTTAPITSACSINASFTPQTFTVTATSDVNGTIATATPMPVNYGTQVVYTLTPNTGYNIGSVSGCNGTLNNNTYTTGPITSVCTINASFTPQTFTVNATSDVNGTITPATTTVNYGTQASFTLTPNTGYTIGTVTPTGCTGALNNNVYTTGAITSNCTITVGYIIKAPAVMSLLAGNIGGIGNLDGIGTSAWFNYPYGLASDSVGNIYVADTSNHTIRKISSVGVVTTFAGTAGVPGVADGIGTTASFNNPSGIATDSAGNIYVADTNNSLIRKITIDGVVTTIAGSVGKSGSTDGVAASATFFNPHGIATDSLGNIYIADTNNSTIRQITPAGLVSTIAGSAGVRGSADGTGSAALFNSPYGITADSLGNIYVADTNNKTIRKIVSGGIVTTLAGLAGVSGSVDGTGTSAQFNVPTGITTDSTGNIYVADTNNYTIRKVTSGGVVTTISGSAGINGYVDGTGTNARFDIPEGISIDNVGNIYVADTYNNAIRKITSTGLVTTIAGSVAEPNVIDGIGIAARFWYPWGITKNNIGNLNVTEYGSSTVRQVSPTGAVSTVAGSTAVFGATNGIGNAASFNRPYGITSDVNGNLYIADTYNQLIRQITSNGVVSTFAGSAGVVGFTDGISTSASFNYPEDVTIDSFGNIYVVDSINNTIRKISTAGVVTTFAGTAGVVGSNDGIGTAAHFNQPAGIAIDSADNLYITDSYNHTIRKISPTGVVTTFAGTAGVIGSTDSSGIAASFYYPGGIAIDTIGNVYVADQKNNLIRKITQTGVVSTLIGTRGQFGFRDGALPGVISGPRKITVIGNTLYFTMNNGVVQVQNLF